MSNEDEVTDLSPADRFGTALRQWVRGATWAPLEIAPLVILVVLRPAHPWLRCRGCHLGGFSDSLGVASTASVATEWAQRRAVLRPPDCDSGVLAHGLDLVRELGGSSGRSPQAEPALEGPHRALRSR